MTNAPDGAFTPDEGTAILDMTEWASAHHRDLHWAIPAMPWKHDSLAGLPVSRTNFPGRLDLIGRRSRFGEPCVLCTLHRTPDGPRVEGIPEPVAAMPVEAHRPSPLRGLDLSRIAAPRFSLALAGGGALVVSGVLAGIAPVVATAATPAVQPTSMPGLMPDPVQPVDPDVGGNGGNDGFHEKPGQPGVPDFDRPLDPTEGDLKDDHTQAGRGAAAGVPAPASLDDVIPPAGQGLDAAGGSDGSGNPYAPAQVDPTEVVGGGHKLESRTETREVPAEVESGDDEPQEGAAAEVVDDAVDRGEEWIEEQDDSAAEVAEVASVEPAPEPEFEPAPAPAPEPMPLPEPVEPPVTEAPPAVPVPIEAAEVTPADSAEVERPAGVQDPADLREAAGHYRTAADLLEQAADEIEAGDAALAGESAPEVSDGQGGGVDTDTVEDGPTDGAGVDPAPSSDVDLDGARVEVTISGLEITVNGETETVDVELDGTVDVDDAEADTVVSGVDSDRGTVQVDTADEVTQPDKAA